MKFSDFITSEPEGDMIAGPPAMAPTSEHILTGQHVILRPLQISDSKALFDRLGGVGNEYLYKYLPVEPLLDLESFTKHMAFLLTSDPAFFTYTVLKNNASRDAVGIVCFLNIVVPNRSIEIGHVLFGKSLQRTTAATEVHYLLMKHAFEALCFLRVEWKANSLNIPSTRAALRLGFKTEGIFRKHQIVKGRRRDTAWYSIIDEDWNGGVKYALEQWLDVANFDVSGNQKKRLEQFREVQ